MIRRLWLVGCGNMAGAMLERWLARGTLVAGDVFVINRTDRALPQGVRQGRAAPNGPLPDAVLLGCKPQQLDEAAAAHAAALAGAPLIISILAGVGGAAIARRFPGAQVVRAMPNLPVALGRGVVALQADAMDEAARVRVGALMAPLGLVESIDAALFDAVTALAGSGPAFVYRFIDALAAGGAALGIPPDQAARLALATVAGGAVYASEAGESPAALANRVASPGGSTRKGLDVLDEGHSLERLVARTLAASAAHNAVLARGVD